jgi:hypothetical protein
MNIDKDALAFVAAILSIMAPILFVTYNVGKLKQMVSGIVDRLDGHFKEHEVIDNRLNTMTQDIGYLKGHQK